MISTRDAVTLRKEYLPDQHGAGGGYVAVLRQPSGKILLKRFVARNHVVNVLDHYERAESGRIETIPGFRSSPRQLYEKGATPKEAADFLRQ